MSHQRKSRSRQDDTEGLRFAPRGDEHNETMDSYKKDRGIYMKRQEDGHSTVPVRYNYQVTLIKFCRGPYPKRTRKVQ